ncbi:hypothetical protein DI270_015770 [Microbispora triticiradicis]|uniref:Uncharacterized protein n=1 Tax=Microbispora triticiradicis TaxID=2200763 RepID=A0ABX9LJK9_9ACTN|nr:hypothetical protein [Microbispora triticiradicis]RGA04166.1 hypothetical protein DI270_015770 [Microbispora triticiradicis]
MGEFVGVDPENLKELTKRLEHLHDLLARQGPAIHQKMQKWGSELSFASLSRLIAAALDDVRDMDARTTRAYELAREQGWSVMTRAPGVLGPVFTRPPVVRLDWEATGWSGDQGRRDAEALTAALAAKDPEAARAALSTLPEHLERHLADKDYQAAFWAGAGPLAVQAARTLYNRTGPALFSAESVGILRALGASLAAASRMRVGTGKESRPLLSTAARDAMTRGSDPWSAGMLAKYGPDGRSWDPRLLADLTRTMLDARAAGKTIWPPARGEAETDTGATRHQRLMAEFDAVGAVLRRAAENGVAARHVLGDPATGLRYARMLVSDSWHTPGYDPGRFLSSYVHPGGALPPVGRVDLSTPVGAFLKAAVSAERGTSADAEESAWSVVHIVQATADFARLHPQTVLPNQVRQALIYVAGRHLPDFAQSVNHDFASGALQQGNKPSNPWVAINKLDELEGFFMQALQKPEEFGVFKGLMASRVSTAVAATIQDPSDRNYLREMGGLFGLIQRVENTHHFEKELRADEEAARDQVLLATASGGFGALSFSNPFGPGTMAEIMTALATPALNDTLDTGHALKALKADMDASRRQVFQVEVPVVQGLLDAGAVHPPPDAPWVRGGRVIPDAALVDWISLHADTRYAGKTLTDWITDAQTAMRMQQ